MSKYGCLVEPLSCLWQTGSDGSVCGETFKSVKLFTDHMRNHHISQNPGPLGNGGNSHGVVCAWSGCEQVVPVFGGQKDYVTHVLFHPYHCYLKLLGLEFQEKMKLPACQYNSLFSNVVQPLEVELKCLWNNGSCQQLFDNVWDFYSHVRDHIKCGGIENRCLWKDCTFTGRDRNKVLEHSRTHLQEKLIACPNCGMRFSNNTKLKDHLNRQVLPTGDPELTCQFCHKCFPNPRLLREHARRHINSVKCPYCDLTCQGPSRLLHHIRYRHVPNKSYQCPLCHKSYKTVQSLSLHIETHGEYSVICKWPGCSFLAKSERLLRIHEHSIHQNVGNAKLFCCHVCSSRFLLGRQLTSHLKKIHGFELPPGHCRFRYVPGKDGLKRLQTVRLDDENLYTPELNTFTASSNSKHVAAVQSYSPATLLNLQLEGDFDCDGFDEGCGTNNDESQQLTTNMNSSHSQPCSNPVPISTLTGSNRYLHGMNYALCPSLGTSVGAVNTGFGSDAVSLSLPSTSTTSSDAEYCSLGGLVGSFVTSDFSVPPRSSLS